MGLKDGSRRAKTLVSSKLHKVAREGKPSLGGRPGPKKGGSWKVKLQVCDFYVGQRDKTKHSRYLFHRYSKEVKQLLKRHDFDRKHFFSLSQLEYMVDYLFFASPPASVPVAGYPSDTWQHPVTIARACIYCYLVEVTFKFKAYARLNSQAVVIW